MAAFGPVGIIIMGVTTVIQALINQLRAAKAAADEIQNIRNEKADNLLDLGKRAQNLTSEDERKALLEDIQRQKMALTSRAASPGNTRAQEQALSEYAMDLDRLARAARKIALKPQAAAEAPQADGPTAEQIAAEQKKVAEDRKRAVFDLVKWRESEELAAEEDIAKKREILMKRTGLGNLGEVDARISELGKLLATGNSSTSGQEAEELKRLTGLRAQLSSADRDIAKKEKDAQAKATSEQQRGINDQARDAAQLLDPSRLPSLRVFADSARSMGLGGNAATNQSEIAKVQAERQREANSLLRNIRDLLAKNSGLKPPQGDLVFS